MMISQFSAFQTLFKHDFNLENLVGKLPDLTRKKIKPILAKNTGSKKRNVKVNRKHISF